MFPERSKDKPFPITPNCITLLGLPIGAASGFFLYQGSHALAILFLVLLCGCDLLDGALAKKKGMSTPFGAFLDSTVDRITELSLFMGLLFFYLRNGSWITAGVTYWAMGGSFVISYSRARAENLIENCRVGFWERPERMGLLLFGLLTGRLENALWILALGVTHTVCQRILHTRWILAQRVPSSALGFFFKHYPRKSWPYRIYATLVVLLAFSLKIPY